MHAGCAVPPQSPKDARRCASCAACSASRSGPAVGVGIVFVESAMPILLLADWYASVGVGGTHAPPATQTPFSTRMSKTFFTRSVRFGFFAHAAFVLDPSEQARAFCMT